MEGVSTSIKARPVLQPRPGPHFVETDDVRGWLLHTGDVREVSRSIGAKRADDRYVSDELGVPPHLRFVLDRLAEEGATGRDVLDSIPFRSLCHGLFLPLTLNRPELAAELFGVRRRRPTSEQREAVVVDFLERNLGLTLPEKLACVMGDPFFGRASTFRQDSLLRLLTMMRFVTRAELLDRLGRVGDVSVLFAEGIPRDHAPVPLTATEVLRTLRFLPGTGINERFEVLRSILVRCTRIEAYFLAKLLLSRTGFGFEFRRPFLAGLMAQPFDAEPEAVAQAVALTDVFHVAEVLEREGAKGLRAIRLQPLVPIRPALAGGSVADLTRFPCWVERKYDGVRMLLHKSTDARGSVLCAAYTRNANDWLELVPGLDRTIRALPASTLIVDGELHGTVVDVDGIRPATVYEVMSSLHGTTLPISYRFAAFDVLFFDGRDVTNLPLSERRDLLETLVGLVRGGRLPVPISVAEGQLADRMADVNRLYAHFRSQGHEGVITKQLDAPYVLAGRDPNWRKKKPELTLDLVVLGATFAVNSSSYAAFGSYVIAARTLDGRFEDVGDVDGVDAERDLRIREIIARDGLLTGGRIERKLTEGTRAGVELRPALVVTVVVQGVERDAREGTLSLRHPRIGAIRTDKSPAEADTMREIEAMYLDRRYG